MQTLHEINKESELQRKASSTIFKTGHAASVTQSKEKQRLQGNNVKYKNIEQ
jgi:hypothetical protein